MFSKFVFTFLIYVLFLLSGYIYLGCDDLVDSDFDVVSLACLIHHHNSVSKSLNS